MKALLNLLPGGKAEYPSPTHSLRSGGSIRSRSAAKLLHSQKTKLSCLATVCSGHSAFPSVCDDHRRARHTRAVNILWFTACIFLAVISVAAAADRLDVTDPVSGFKDWNVREFKGNAVIERKTAPAPSVVLTSSQTSFALAKEMKFELAQHRFLNFSWMIEKLPAGGDVRNKNTDDQAGQVYVIFPSFPEAINYKAIGYVWDSTAPAGVYQSKKSGNVKYVVLHSGRNGLGQWFHEKRDVYADFKELWDIRADKSRKIVVSVSIDSDDTKSSAQSTYGPVFFTQK